MAARFVGLATKIETMTIDGFIQYFSSDVHEIVKYMEGQGVEEKFRKLFALHQRHAEKVNKVIETKCQENISALRKGILPESCLVSMVARGEHLKGRESIIKVEKAKNSTKHRPTKAEMANRNKAVAMAAAQFEAEHGCLPSVDDVIKETELSRPQIYATDAYREGKIAKSSAKVAGEMTGGSIQKTEYYNRESEEHARVKKRTKAEQAELDALIDEQKEDCVKDEKQQRIHKKRNTDDN